MNDQWVDKWLDEFFGEILEMYEIVDLRILNKSEIDTKMSGDKLLQEAKSIALEGPPETKEKQISFLYSSLRQRAKEDPKAFAEELFDAKKRDVAKRLQPYESEEIDPFKPISQVIRGFSEEDLDIIGEWLNSFKETDDGTAYSQQYHQLIENELGPDRKFSIEDIGGLRRGKGVFSDVMNICDAGYAIPVSMYWLSEGKDPRNKDSASMGFNRGLQELEDTRFEAISEHIDMDLRNGVKHGDIVIDPKDEKIRIENGKKEYSFEDMEAAVNSALLTVDIMQVMDTYVSIEDYRRNIDFLEE